MTCSSKKKEIVGDCATRSIQKAVGRFKRKYAKFPSLAKAHAVDQPQSYSAHICELQMQNTSYGSKEHKLSKSNL